MALVSRKAVVSFDHLSGGRIRIVQDYIAVGISDSGVQLRRYISTAVCNGCVSSCQLIRSNTVGQTTQSQGLVHIGLDLIADLDTVGQRGEIQNSTDNRNRVSG